MPRIDESRALIVKNFIEKVCGVPVLDWQWQHWLLPLYGTLLQEGGRWYNSAFFFLGKKSGKSSFAALLQLFAIEETPNAQSYTCASSVKQAKIIFDFAADIARAINAKWYPNNPRYWIRDHYNEIVNLRNNSKFRVLSSVPHIAGYRSVLTTMDEILEWKVKHASMIMDKLQPAIMSHPGKGMNLYVTTAKYDPNHPLKKRVYDYAKKVQANPELDPHWYNYILEADESKWEEEEEWWRVSPSVDKIVPKSWYRNEYKKCAIDPLQEVKFKTEYLNIFCHNSASFIAKKFWDQCYEDFKEEDFYKASGVDCILGIDLAYVHDACSWVIVAKKDDKYYLFPRWCLPEGNIVQNEEKDGQPYRIMATNPAKYHFYLCPGNTTNLDFVYKLIKEDLNNFRIVECAADEYGCEDLRKKIEYDSNIDCIFVDQGPKAMSQATSYFAQLVQTGRIRHNGEHLLSWNLANVVVRHRGDSVCIAKQQCLRPYDAISATLNCINRWLEYEDSSSCGVTVF